MRYIDADTAKINLSALKKYNNSHGIILAADEDAISEWIDKQPTADARDDATAHKVVGGGEHDGATCWFECDNCGLAVDIGDVFCKHCGARFVP